MFVLSFMISCCSASANQNCRLIVRALEQEFVQVVLFCCASNLSCP
jgi:hypothetical protein